MKFSMDKTLNFAQAVELMFEKLGESKIMALATKTFKTVSNEEVGA